MNIEKCWVKKYILMIFYNEAFYYSSIITIVQISMMFISGFSGVKNMIGNIRHLLSKLHSKKNFGRKITIQIQKELNLMIM